MDSNPINEWLPKNYGKAELGSESCPEQVVSEHYSVFSCLQEFLGSRAQPQLVQQV